MTICKPCTVRDPDPDSLLRAIGDSTSEVLGAPLGNGVLGCPLGTVHRGDVAEPALPGAWNTPGRRLDTQPPHQTRQVPDQRIIDHRGRYDNLVVAVGHHAVKGYTMMPPL